MPDYKELYLTMVRASETAICALVEAQQRCEAVILDEAEEAKPETGQGKGRI